MRAKVSTDLRATKLFLAFFTLYFVIGLVWYKTGWVTDLAILLTLVTGMLLLGPRFRSGFFSSLTLAIVFGLAAYLAFDQQLYLSATLRALTTLLAIASLKQPSGRG